MNGLNDQPAIDSICFAIDAGDKSAALEDRQRKIAILSFGGRHVAFNLIIKIKEGNQLISLNDQIVKRRENVNFRADSGDVL